MLARQPDKRTPRYLIPGIRQSLGLSLAALIATGILGFSDHLNAMQSTSSWQHLPIIGAFLPELEFAPTETDEIAASVATSRPKLTPTSATFLRPASSKDGGENENDLSTGKQR